MKTYFDPTELAKLAAGSSTKKRANGTTAQEFAKYIAKCRNQATAEMLQRKQKADDRAAQDAKRKRDEKINDLLAMIARLRTKIGVCGDGEKSGLEAQLSQLQSELTMLLLFI